jgi:L-asparaginase/Glu-tRNA(Gln) amidotransferase subunit D
VRKRVHVVFTGGTIGSVAGESGTRPDDAPPRQLLSHTPAGHEIDFSESEPFRILSEDATPAHWTLLARHVAALDFAALDAVVVAHGSDTLAWTATALAYALEGCPRPVVLVAADRPLSDKRSNGPDNFRDALSFALTEHLPGVFAAWRNPDEETAIHLATRILPCDVHDDRFRSANGLVFGTVAGGEFRRHAVEGNPSRSRLAKASTAAAWTRSRERAAGAELFEASLLVLPACPAGRLPTLDGPDWKAVVRLAYHSGTASSDAAVGGFAEFAQQCRERGIEVVVGPRRPGAPRYESVQRLVDRGVVFAPHLTEAALVAKTMWLLAQGRPLSSLADPVGFDLLFPRD